MDTARRNIEDPKQRNYILENIIGELGLATKLQRSYIAMSKSEMEKYFTHKQKKKRPSCAHGGDDQ